MIFLPSNYRQRVTISQTYTEADEDQNNLALVELFVEMSEHQEAA